MMLPVSSIYSLAIIAISVCLYYMILYSEACGNNVYVTDWNVPRYKWEGRHLDFNPGNASDYEILRPLGIGYFGTVYLALQISTHKHVAIKSYNETRNHEKNALMEALMLQTVCGGPHIMQLLDVIALNNSSRRSLVFEYTPATPGDMISIWMSLSPPEFQHYFKQLIKALAYVHSKEVVHRDLQFHNVLIDKQNKQATLIDFGESHFQEPMANRHFRGNLQIEAPEVLFGHIKRDNKTDMWSFGLMLASVAFQKFPFLTNNAVGKLVAEIAEYLGTNDLAPYVKELGQPPLGDSIVRTSMQQNRTNLYLLVNEKNKHYATPEAVDLIDKILRWNPKDRLSAQEALQHPFFHLPAEI